MNSLLCPSLFDHSEAGHSLSYETSNPSVDILCHYSERFCRRCIVRAWYPPSAFVRKSDTYWTARSENPRFPPNHHIGQLRWESTSQYPRQPRRQDTFGRLWDLGRFPSCTSSPWQALLAEHHPAPFPAQLSLMNYSWILPKAQKIF